METVTIRRNTTRHKKMKRNDGPKEGDRNEDRPARSATHAKETKAASAAVGSVSRSDLGMKSRACFKVRWIVLKRLLFGGSDQGVGGFRGNGKERSVG